jgi:hypothetical protein
MKNFIVQMILRITIAGISLLGTAHAIAEPLSGTHNIVLSNASGEHHTIGKIIFSDGGNGKTAFQIEMASNMEEFFLAMRPFLCLTGEKQRLCWFPVKNEKALISPDDLLPLEYALMFMRTKAKDLHVNPFNGLYYKLSWTQQGITGKLFEVDMAPFIAPDTVPLERRQRPLEKKDFYEADLGSNWLPMLRIE